MHADRGYGRYDGRYNPFAITDEAGRFKIDSLPTGYASLQCRSGSYYAPSSELYAVPSENVQIKMATTGTVKGKVTLTEGQKKPRQIIINMNPPGERVGKWGSSMQCKPDGSFEFTSVPPGEYCLHTTPEVPDRDSDKGRWITAKPGITVTAEVPYR